MVTLVFLWTSLHWIYYKKYLEYCKIMRLSNCLYAFRDRFWFPSELSITLILKQPSWFTDTDHSISYNHSCVRVSRSSPLFSGTIGKFKYHYCITGIHNLSNMSAYVLVYVYINIYRVSGSYIFRLSNTFFYKRFLTTFSRNSTTSIVSSRRLKFSREKALGLEKCIFFVPLNSVQI